MSVVEETTLEVPHATDAWIEGVVEDDAGAPVNLTTPGVSLTLTIRPTPTTPAPTLVKTSASGQISRTSNGVFVAALTVADGTVLLPGTYAWALILVTSTAATLVARGTLVVVAHAGG